ncbi:hypothetical protein MBLNU230_g8274t1 [Neophaeotheca triangularis]
MDAIFADFTRAHVYQSASDGGDGQLLASTITPDAPKNDPGRLYHFYRSTNPHMVPHELEYRIKFNSKLPLDPDQQRCWIDTFTTYHTFVGELLLAEEAQNAAANRVRDEWGRVYAAWKKVVNSIYKGYQTGCYEAWTIPCLYVVVRYLRIFATKADESADAQKDSGVSLTGMVEDEEVGTEGKNTNLKDAANQIQRVFGLCANDRSPIEDSRKWALYNITNALFRTYSRLNSVSLSKNILKSLRALSDLPDISLFPASHRVTFHFYVGRIHFLEEDYAQATEHLSSAFALCPASHTRNAQRILTYLIPTKLVAHHKLPSPALLAPYPHLEALFAPFRPAVKTANLAAFDAALEAGEASFIRTRTHLTLERARDIVVRNVLRKVFLAAGYEDPKPDAPPDTPRVRKTRIEIKAFAQALADSGAEIGDGQGGFDTDEVECLIANLIYKDLLKGYIAHEAGKVVLNKKGAFPGTGV